VRSFRTLRIACRALICRRCTGRPRTAPAALFLLVVLLTAAPAAIVTAQSAEEPAAVTPAIVRPTFAWTPGLRAEVVTTRTRTRVSGNRTSRAMTSRYTLQVASADDGLRIHFSDPVLKIEGDGVALPAGSQAQMVAQMADLLPDYLVSKDGTFAGVHDLPAVQRKVQAFLATVLPKEAAAAEVLAQVQAMVTSEAFLNARAAEQWNAVVGAWTGAELEVGAEYESSNTEPIPVLPGQHVLMRYRFSARRLLSCQRDGVARTCAELEMRSVADAADVKRMIQALMASLAGNAAAQAPAFTSIDVENVIRLVTEPEGLIPHSYTLTRIFTGTLSGGGADQSFEQTDETQVRYTYR